MALLPVGPYLSGWAAPGLSAVVFAESDPAVVAEDFVASLALEAAADATGPGLSGSDDFGVDDDAAVALADTALLSEEPGFAGEALGVAVAWDDALPPAAGLAALVSELGLVGLDGAPGFPGPDDGAAVSDGRVPVALSWSFDAVTGVSSPLDLCAPALGRRSCRRR